MNENAVSKDILEFYRLAKKYGFEVPFCVCEEECECD